MASSRTVVERHAGAQQTREPRVARARRRARLGSAVFRSCDSLGEPASSHSSQRRAALDLGGEPVELLERRVDAGLDGELAQQATGEAVDGADGRVVEGVEGALDGVGARRSRAPHAAARASNSSRMRWRSSPAAFSVNVIAATVRTSPAPRAGSSTQRT